jgi:hypothetical protein
MPDGGGASAPDGGGAGANAGADALLPLLRAVELILTTSSL